MDRSLLLVLLVIVVLLGLLITPQFRIVDGPIAEAPADESSANRDTTGASESDEADSEPSVQENINELTEQGRQLAIANGCLGCHSLDGSGDQAGPTWLGVYGQFKIMEDGTEVLVDEAYIKESILDPDAKIVQGYFPLMQPYEFNKDEIEAIVAFIQSLVD